MSRHIPIAELADWLCPAPEPWKAMALLRAFFDESGIDGRLAVTGYAGFCATKTQWEQVESEWAAALADFQVEWFHMVDLVHGRNQHEHTNVSDLRDPMLRRFSKGIRERVDKNRLVPLWSAVEHDAWGAAQKPKAFTDRFPKPLDLSFDHIVHQMRRFSRLYAKANPIAPMFADSIEYSERNKEVYDAYKRHPDWSGFLGPIAFGSPRQVIPLQPADMFAYELTTYFDRLEGDYFARVRGLNYRPVIDDISKVIDLNMSGCVGRAPLVRIIEKFVAGQPLWD